MSHDLPGLFKHPLKAKARLWWILSSAIVFAALFFAAARFPGDIWLIMLVGIGWWFFSRSLAEKAVTLVKAPSSSGEPEPVSRSRQWVAMLGTLAFGSGILTRNWHLAIIGVVFSSLTAAAMWQNLRARLPYLFDSWSEKLPQAPTLLHAMIAIASMAEGVALTTAIAASVVGPALFNMARAIAYGVGSSICYLVVQEFLNKRGVRASAVWNWKDAPAAQRPVRGENGLTVTVVCGALAGGVLGLLAVGYRQLILNFPAVREFLEPSGSSSLVPQGSFWWLALLTIGFAPVAEEYLFRGLLYRALDREWGGWHAIVGSAAFFAIYHPPFSWLPVGMLGALNAFLFKKTRRLVPCVLCHMMYNSVVLLIK